MINHVDEDTPENFMLRIILWLEGWGRLVRTQSLAEAILQQRNWQCVVAWVAVLGVAIAMALFYILLNRTAAWVAFVAFFVVDAGVSYAGLAVLLLSPVETALGGGVHRPSQTKRGDDPSLLQDSEQSSMILLNATSTPPTPFFRVDRFDSAIIVHIVIGFLSILSSCMSDDILQARQDNLSIPIYFFFLLADALEDFFYVVGFVLLAVSYRVIAVRVWAEKHSLDELLMLPNEERSNSSLSLWASLLIGKIGETRQHYESIFIDAEHLSARTGALGLTMILLAAIEMASSLDNVFSNQIDNWDASHLAVLRLLIVLACCILQITLAAADVHYASERLAKVLRIVASEAQQKYASSFVTTLYGSVGNDEPPSTWNDGMTEADPNRVLAQTAQTLASRVGEYPIRMRVSWFHLTTEWAFGICALVFTILLAVVGIKLPGGD